MSEGIVQLYQYNQNVLEIRKEDEAFFLKNFKPEEQPELQHWLNYHSMECKQEIQELCDALGIDKLLQEDLFCGTKRPRLEEYDGYVFFSILSALPKERSDFGLRIERISFLMGSNYLISFQERRSDHFPEVRERLEMKKGKIRFRGPDFLLFRMLEAIVDNYYEVLEEIADRTEDLERLLVRFQRSDILRQIEWQKRKLIELRKIVMPIRELVTQMERTENELFSRDNRHYFQDLKDSCVVVIEEIDSQKLILEGLVNLYYAAQGQKMNEIMKVLTVFSVVFIPLTFIAGVYGMNFEYMPELKWTNGYYYALGAMGVIGAGLLLLFWKRGWLRRN